MLYLFCVFVLVVQVKISTGTAVPCERQSDCVDPNRPRCSICADDAKTKTSHCMFPFPYMYKSDRACEYVDCNKKCRNGGLCIILHENGKDVNAPYCTCPGLSYGEECEYTGGVNNDTDMSDFLKIYSVRWTFKGIVYIDLDTTFELNVEADTMSKSLVDADEADFYFPVGKSRIRKTVESMFFTSKLDDRGHKVYTILGNHTFTFENYDRPGTLMLGGVALGYIALLEMDFKFTPKVNTPLQIVSHKLKYPIFVSYEKAAPSCTPSMKLSDCGSTVERPVKFLRSSQIEVYSRMIYTMRGKLKSGPVTYAFCDSITRVSWRLWELRDGRDIAVQDTETHSRKARFAPFSRPLGKYKISFKMVTVQSHGISVTPEECYFNVVSLKLVAVINGGSDRRVFKRRGLLLSAEQSHDPNSPSSRQDHLNIEWSCVNLLEPSTMDAACSRKQLKVSQPYFIPPEKLKYSAVYNFTMKIWTHQYSYCQDCLVNRPAFADVRVEVTNETEKEEDSIVIRCEQNCQQKVPTNRILFLKATAYNNSIIDLDYKWSYYKGDETEKLIDLKNMKDLPSYMFILEEDTLEDGVWYTVIVRVASSEQYAKYSFETDKIEYNGSCSVSPENGVKGFTHFDIICTMYADAVYRYEFYNKRSEDITRSIIFSGRMLGTSSTGQLTDVILTRENVYVYIINTYGTFIENVITVNLSELEVTEVVLDGMYANLAQEVRSENSPRILSYISFIPDIVPSGLDKTKVLYTLLQHANQASVKSVADVKLCTSTLTNVLLTLNAPERLELNPYMIMLTLQTIKKQADIFNNKVSDRVDSQWMPPREIKQVGISLLNCLRAGILSRGRQTENLDEDTLDLTTAIYLRQRSIYAEQSIDFMKNILSYIQSPGQPITSISSADHSFVVWVMENDSGYKIRQMLQKQSDVPVLVSNALQKYLENRVSRGKGVGLQVVYINDNIFWWRVSDVKSDLVSVSLVETKKNEKLKPIENIDKPLEVIVKLNRNLTSANTSGTVIQLDPKLNPLDLDLNVKIHRLDHIPRSLICIKFLFPPTNASLRVLLMEEFRPDYELMIDKSSLITEQSPIYTVPPDDHNQLTFLYMGILPGPDLPVNQSVTYCFEVNSTLCQIWAKGQWTSSGCLTGSDIGSNETRCFCTHFSIFAAAFPVPPEEIDPFADAKLFLTVLENPLVVCFVAIILLVYLLLCFYFWRQDRRDQRLRVVIILEDNFPTDRHPYMLAVYTSSRFNAGTTAHVGIRLNGKSFNSRSHILSCNDRKVLQKNTDDWFLIYCPEPLGDITSLHMWHDNFGSSPQWYCDKIHVHDLTERVEVMFVIGQWFDLRVFEYPEAYVIPASASDVMNVKRIFLDNCLISLRQDHIIFGIIKRHPRSEVTRLQKLSTFICCLLVTMLCSIMFYVPHTDHIGEDDYHYSIGTRDMVVSIQSLIISLLVTFIVLFAFRKSHEYTYLRQKSTLRLRDDESSQTSLKRAEDLLKSSKKKTIYQKFVDVVLRMVKHQSIEPVDLPFHQSAPKTRKTWLFVAWTSCIIVIIGCSYLVMLYSLKLGSVKSKAWLSSVGLAMATEIFLLGPFRIVLFSSLLAFTFQSMINVNTHRISLNDVRLVRLPDDEEYLFKLLEKRLHPMYTPMRSDVRAEMIRTQEVRRKWWNLVDFMNSLCLVVALSIIISRMWSSHYYSNNHVTKVATLTKHVYFDSINFYDIQNISQMERFLENTFISAVYELRWYNGLSLSSSDRIYGKYWAADFTHRMLGLPIVRQLRVKLTTCRTVFFQGAKCIPRWSHRADDTNLYGVRWSPASWDDAERKNSPWKYTGKSKISLFTHYRLSRPNGRIYDDGGYLVTLGPTRHDTEVTLADLREYHWQDIMTRVIFVELSLYNPNEDMMSQVTLIVEYLITGTITLTAYTLSIHSTVILTPARLLLIVFILYYFCRCVPLINRQGLLEFLSDGNNVYRIVITILGCSIVGLFFAHYYKSYRYMKWFERSGQGSNFDFDSFVLFYIPLRTLISFLVFIVILHLIVQFRGGRSFITHYYTFKLSLSGTLWLTTVFILLIITLLQVGYAMNFFTLLMIKEKVIKYQSTRPLRMDQLEQTHVRVFLLVKFVSAAILLACFVVLFMYYSKAARLHKLKDSDQFNFVTFFVKQLVARRKSRKLLKRK